MSKEGVYRLKSDTVNPKGDKRIKHEINRIAVWPVGLRFRVARQPLQHDEVDWLYISFIDDPHEILCRVPEYDERFPVLMANAEEIPEDFDAWAKDNEIYTWAREILDYMVTVGDVSREKILEYKQAVVDNYDKENPNG